jgi:hypothetical protein
MLLVIFYSILLRSLLAVRPQAIFEEALETDDLVTLRSVLSEHSESVEPSVQGSMALIKACINCDADLVKTLVRHPRVSLDKVDPLYEAAKFGCVTVVKELLNESKIDLARSGSIALREAVQKGHLRIVKVLLEDERVQPADQGSICLVDAVQSGRLEFLQALLLDGRADPRAQGSRAMSVAASLGRDDMVTLLLIDGRASVGAAMAAATGTVTYLFAGLPESMFEESDPEFLDETMLEWTSPLQLDILLARARSNEPMFYKLFMFKLGRAGLKMPSRMRSGSERLRLSSLGASMDDEISCRHQ